MVSQISVLGITFHLYGFIVGIALVVGVQIFFSILEKQKSPLPEAASWAVLCMLLGAGVGARLWHVATDYWLYMSNPVSILYIWNGGLSNFGGLLGGIVSFFAIYPRYLTSLPKLAYLDAAALALPIGQSIGRVANYVNQELYGIPTSLPWGISISPEHRVKGYEAFSTFHPLFAYEALLLLLVAAILWSRREKAQIGSGWFIRTYVASYLCIRLALDFLRIDAPRILLGMTGNQLVLLGIGVAGVLWFFTNRRREQRG